jgi:hypothetical protein
MIEQQLTARGEGRSRPRHSRIFARAEHDHYVEPAWCSARLFAVESFGPPGARVLDPACGWGRILRAAKRAGYTPIGGDIVDRLQRRELGLHGVAFSRRDFLTAPIPKDITSVVCNSPFKGDLLRRFCERAVETAKFAGGDAVSAGAHRRRPRLASKAAAAEDLCDDPAPQHPHRQIHCRRRQGRGRSPGILLVAVRPSCAHRIGTAAHPLAATRWRCGVTKQYEIIEAYSLAPFLELFARGMRLGWVTWGDQVDASADLFDAAAE